MVQTSKALELDRPAAWSAAGQDEEARWPVHRTALFVVGTSAALWAGIFALIGWLW